MFLSKIWIFLIAVVATVSLTIAIVMPRPAARAAEVSDRQRLTRACGIADILLRDSARARIQLAGEFSRAAGLDEALLAAGKGDIVTGEAHSAAKTLLQSLNVRGSESLAKRVDVTLLDRHGRAVARSGKKASEYGDSLAGYFLVDDALDGYLRDDLWNEQGNLYMVAGSPVVTRGLDWAGAVVIRELIDKDLTDGLARQLDADVSFYVAGEAVATSNPVGIHEDVLARFAELAPPAEGGDCANNVPFTVEADDQSYWVQIARLPGEAGAVGAFYAVFAPRGADLGFAGTLGAVVKDDLSFGSFPWVPMIGLFLLLVVIGIGLTVWESDRPLRRLAHDSVRLAKGDAERLDEDKHPGKFGSIARSLNIAIDKVHREARAAKKDLDNLLGPPPAAATPLPPAPRGDSGSFAPPPPSEFKFSAPPAVAMKPGAAASQPVAPVAIDLSVPPAEGFDIEHDRRRQRQPLDSAGSRMSASTATNEQIAPAPISLPSFDEPATPTPPPAAAKKPPLPSAARTPRPQSITPPPIGVPAARPAPEPRPAPAAFLDDDVLGAGRKSQVISIEDGEHETDAEDDETRVAPGAAEDASPEEVYFREIFGEFVAMKRRCGESIDSLTYARFSRKLAANRDALMAKHACKSVKFQVYIKDGKAALKASPVRG